MTPRGSFRVALASLLFGILCPLKNRGVFGAGHAQPVPYFGTWLFRSATGRAKAARAGSVVRGVLRRHLDSWVAAPGTGTATSKPPWSPRAANTPTTTDDTTTRLLLLLLPLKRRPCFSTRKRGSNSVLGDSSERPWMEGEAHRLWGHTEAVALAGRWKERFWNMGTE